MTARKRCPHCVGGTYVDQNRMPHRCYLCRGSGFTVAREAAAHPGATERRAAPQAPAPHPSSGAGAPLFGEYDTAAIAASLERQDKRYRGNR